MIKSRKEKLAQLVKNAELNNQLAKIAQAEPDNVTSGDEYAEDYFQALLSAMFPDVTE